MADYRKLKVWQRAHQLTAAVYKATMAFPQEELYGLTNQIRRASVSIPANIAEGYGRGGDVEFARFLRIALGSLNELEYLLLLSRDLGLLPQDLHGQLAIEVTEVRMMITGLLGRLAARSDKPAGSWQLKAGS